MLPSTVYASKFDEGEGEGRKRENERERKWKDPYESGLK